LAFAFAGSANSQNEIRLFSGLKGRRVIPCRKFGRRVMRRRLFDIVESAKRPARLVSSEGRLHARAVIRRRHWDTMVAPFGAAPRMKGRKCRKIERR